MLASILTFVATLALTVSAAPTTRATTSGINSWDCKATPGHDPVIFLHGLGAPSGVNWFANAPKVALKGYCVYTPQYGTVNGILLGWKSMRESSKEVAAFVEKVRASTGAEKVNIVGHSMGTTVGTYYMKFDGGNTRVNNFIGFGANYHGTTLYGLNLLVKLIPGVSPALREICASCDEFLPPSSFITDLNAGGITVPGPKYTTIVSKLDEIVLPYTSGIINEPGVTNIVLQDHCPLDIAGHLSQAIDPNVSNLILWALNGGTGPRPWCIPFLIPGRRDGGAAIEAA